MYKHSVKPCQLYKHTLKNVLTLENVLKLSYCNSMYFVQLTFGSIKVKFLCISAYCVDVTNNLSTCYALFVVLPWKNTFPKAGLLYSMYNLKTGSLCVTILVVLVFLLSSFLHHTCL